MTVAAGERHRTGRLVYGERAFEQDAQNAMRGDIVRGLIELITNADDAYARMEASGKIRIEVEHRRKGASWQAIVRDRATGMTQTEMESRLVEIGGRVSGFESGRPVRGNLGRGAKDLVAFGEVTYEAIRDGQFAWLRLLPHGYYEAPERKRGVTKEDRVRLGIPANGTVVTVQVRPGVRCPNHGTLKKRLSAHYQLRDIMADAKRDLVLVNLNNHVEQDRLEATLAETELVCSVTLPIPGYPSATAQLEVRRLPERCDQSATDPYRPCGILLKGGRAIYENTLFVLEANPYAAFLHGGLRCPYIDTLAREYDEFRTAGRPLPPSNPIPIISRSRDGLQKEHPFYVGLRGSAERVLQEIVRKEEDRARQVAARVENERTRRDLDRLAREAARFMDEELREAEAEPLSPGRGPDAIKPLAIVPDEVICYIGEPRTLTVVASRGGLEPGATASATCDPEGIIELTDELPLDLQPHRRRDDVLVAQMHLQPLLAGHTLVECELAGRLAQALVEVRDEREQVPAQEPSTSNPPTVFEFEHDRYRIGWTHTKTLVLRAPSGTCEAGTTAAIASSSPGIVVLRNRVPLELDTDLEFLIGRVRIEGRAFGAEGTIRATLGELTAECRVMVRRDDDGPSLQFSIEDKYAGKYRALWEDSSDPATGVVKRVLEIQGRHPALQRFLGEPPDFPGQDTPAARLLVAEIVADNVCREVARRIDLLRQQDERPDAEGFYGEHYSRLQKLLPRFQDLLLPTTVTISPDNGISIGTAGAQPGRTGAPATKTIRRCFEN